MRKTLRNLLILSLVFVYLLVGIGSAFAIERVTVAPATTRAKASKSYMFKIAGTNQNFILLDETSEGFFVLSEKYAATRPISASGEPVPYDPKDENSVAHWLNGDFLTSGIFPKEIIDNLVERVYKTEGGGSKVPFSKDYESTCKIVLLSQTEWSKYNARFGYADDTSVSFWALRTVRELTGAPLVAAQASPNSGLTVEGKWTSSTGIRPAFYLSKDFFEKVSLDLSATGDAVFSLVRNKNDKATLSSLYSSSDVYNLTESDIAPMVDTAYIVGRGIVGETINGNYKFLSLDTKAENGTTIQWQRSKNKTSWSTIIGAEDINYVPTEYDVGHYIRMKVTPMTASTAGSSYESAPLGNVIRPISAPVASNIRIVSEDGIRPGSIVEAKYSYNDENRDICSESEYFWELSEDKVTAESLDGTKYLKLTNDTAGKFIRVGVIAKKKTNSAAGRMTVSGDLAYSEWISVEDLPMVTGVELAKGMDISITASKKDGEVFLTSSLTLPGNEKLTAMYEVAKSDEFETVCLWEGATTPNGSYSTLATDVDNLEFLADAPLWVRAKVYTRNAENKGNAIYSAPMYIGEGKKPEAEGELSVTKALTSGKTYEIWISNDSVVSSFAYSIAIEGLGDSLVVSDKYLINKISQANKTYAIGTLNSGVCSEGFSFKAGEITADEDKTITISDALVTDSGSSGVTGAKVFIVER